MRDLAEVEADLEAARARRDRIGEELKHLSTLTDDELSRGQQERFDRLMAGADRAVEEISRFDGEYRDIVRSELRRNARRPGYTENGFGGASERADNQVRLENLGPRRNGYHEPKEDQQVISRAFSLLEREGKHLKSEEQDRVDALLRREPSEEYQPRYIAERILVTERPAYRSALFRSLAAAQVGRMPHLSQEEVDALRAFEVLEHRWNPEISRAAGEVTTTAGGFGVNAFLDPSIIVTSGAADVPILRYCRIEQVTTNLWKGVSSAGISWSYDTEAAEVSDDAPTIAQPSITVHMARGYVPYSIEVGQDWAGFADNIGRLLNQGYNDLLASKTMTGTGTGEPWGIFTAIDQTSASEVTPTTDGSFGGVDVFKVWNALPERYRSRATWVMSTSVESAIRQFSASAGSSSSYFTVDLTQSGLTLINGRPVITTDYAPTMSGAVPGTTGPQNILIVGDLQNYVMANRAGMTIEAIPHVFSTGNGRPTGQRGLFAWARHGLDSVNDNAARLLQNQ